MWCLELPQTQIAQYAVNFDMLAVFICRIFQLPALSKNPSILSLTSDNRFPVHSSSFFFFSWRCFIIKCVRWYIRLQCIYVEYNIMRPKDSCLEMSSATGYLTQPVLTAPGSASEISTKKHYKVQLIPSELISLKVLTLSSMLTKKLKSSCFISTRRKTGNLWF